MTAPSVAKIALKVRISSLIVAVQRPNTRPKNMFACTHKHKRGKGATGLGQVASLIAGLLPTK